MAKWKKKHDLLKSNKISDIIYLFAFSMQPNLWDIPWVQFSLRMDLINPLEFLTTVVGQTKTCSATEHRIASHLCRLTQQTAPHKSSKAQNTKSTNYPMQTRLSNQGSTLNSLYFDCSFDGRTASGYSWKLMKRS